MDKEEEEAAEENNLSNAQKLFVCARILSSEDFILAFLFLERFKYNYEYRFINEIRNYNKSNRS